MSFIAPGVPLNQTPFFGPKSAQHAKRPQFGVSHINPNFFLERFGTTINRYSKKQTAQFQLAG